MNGVDIGTHFDIDGAGTMLGSPASICISILSSPLLLSVHVFGIVGSWRFYAHPRTSRLFCSLCLIFQLAIECPRSLDMFLHFFLVTKFHFYFELEFIIFVQVTPDRT